MSLESTTGNDKKVRDYFGDAQCLWNELHSDSAQTIAISERAPGYLNPQQWKDEGFTVEELQIINDAYVNKIGAPDGIWNLEHWMVICDVQTNEELGKCGTEVREYYKDRIIGDKMWSPIGKDVVLKWLTKTIRFGWDTKNYRFLRIHSIPKRCKNLKIIPLIYDPSDIVPVQFC